MIELPKTYDGKFKQFNGWSKVSYSQYTSFLGYREKYIQEYFLGFKQPSGMFAEYGSAIGDYLETNKRSLIISENDVEILDTIYRPETARYEVEVVINLEPFGLKRTCLQGFIDQEYDTDGVLVLNDFKTGNYKERLNKYGGGIENYAQTRIYAYQRDLEGKKAESCGVVFLGRKGNVRKEDATERNAHNILRLSGEKDYIPTPYNRGEVEDFIQETLVPTVKEISRYYKIFKNVSER